MDLVGLKCRVASHSLSSVRTAAWQLMLYFALQRVERLVMEVSALHGKYLQKRQAPGE
jgi:hypothetical protein